MSIYADYQNLSKNYDKNRPPSGVSLYPGLIYSVTGKVTSDLHILDAGCGTGNHSLYLIQHGVQRITMLDANDGMLQKSRDKLSKYSDRVEILQGFLPKLDFPDAHFDVVMVNQVLHHLNKSDDTEHLVIREALKEMYRVLKPNGIIIVTLGTPCQARNGLWFSGIFRQAFDEYSKRVMSSEKFIELLTLAGFRESNALVPLCEIVLREDCYFRKDYPLDDECLNSNSVTARANLERLGVLEEGQNFVRKLMKEGKLDEYFAEGEARRKEVGQYTIYYGKKC